MNGAIVGYPVLVQGATHADCMERLLYQMGNRVTIAVGVFMRPVAGADDHLKLRPELIVMRPGRPTCWKAFWIGTRCGAG